MKISFSLQTFCFLFLGLSLLPAKEYKIRKGDTIFKIARQFELTPGEILSMNNLSDPDHLVPGLSLTLPAPESSRKTAPPTRIYYSKPGDTYYRIARQFGLSVDQLLRQNERSPESILQIGDPLLIASSRSSRDLPSEPAPPRSSRSSSRAEQQRMRIEKFLRSQKKKKPGDLKLIQTAPAVSGIQSLKKSPKIFSPSKPRPPRKPAPVSHPKAIPQKPSSRPPVRKISSPAPKSEPKPDFPSPAPSKQNIPPAAPPVSSPPKAPKTPLIWPVKGSRTLLEDKLKGIRFSAQPASYVNAIARGEVSWIGSYRDFGEIILIESGDRIYFYGGNDDTFVNVGQKIEKGEKIGRLGTGTKDGNSPMFFSVFYKGKPLDPRDLLAGRF